MPSTRRRLLAIVATGGVATIAGCAGEVPGTGPRDVDTVETGDSRERVWQYPAADVEEHDSGIGYASVTFEGERPDDRTPPSLEFTLNTTVGGIAATDEYDAYEADWARFRLGPPADYDATHQYRMWVQPPPWPGIRTQYENQGARRDLVVELPDIDGEGTITLPVVFDPVETLPDRVRCSVTVQASAPGTFGESVRATGRGTIDLAAARQS